MMCDRQLLVSPRSWVANEALSGNRRAHFVFMQFHVKRLQSCKCAKPTRKALLQCAACGLGMLTASLRLCEEKCGRVRLLVYRLLFGITFSVVGTIILDMGFTNHKGIALQCDSLTWFDYMRSRFERQESYTSFCFYPCYVYRKPAVCWYTLQHGLHLKVLHYQTFHK